MNTSKNYAALLRQKMEETQEMTFGGVTGLFRRVNLTEWARSGKLPQFLVTAMINAKGDAGLFRETDLSREQFVEYLNNRRDIVCTVMVAPKLCKEGEPQEGEILYSDFAERFPEAVSEISQWAYQGCPNIPVKMKGGEEATVQEITSFRDGREDRATASTGGDVQAL